MFNLKPQFQSPEILITLVSLLHQSLNHVRMMKIQQKISGNFRSIEGTLSFCHTRGYISTAKKNQRSVINAIQNAISGEPSVSDLCN